MFAVSKTDSSSIGQETDEFAHLNPRPAAVAPLRRESLPPEVDARAPRASRASLPS